MGVRFIGISEELLQVSRCADIVKKTMYRILRCVFISLQEDIFAD